MLTFTIAMLILLTASLPWVGLSRPPNKPSWLLALYLVGSANVVLSSFVTNSFYLLNQQWAMLLMQALIGGLGWFVWWKTGKPSLWGSFQDWKAEANAKTLFQWLRREPALALFGFCMALCYTFALAQLILIPQNNLDSLSTHLARIGYWYQHGSFFPWPTYMFDQLSYPINAQLQTYWTLLFLGSDRLVGSIQWLAALVSSVGVFGLARLMGFHRRPSAFAALLFLSFPLVALQASTTQTDLVTVAFFLPAVYFLFLGLPKGSQPLLALSAISVGVGIGVKKSYFLLLPVLGVLALLALFQFGRGKFKQLVIWAIYLMVGIGLLGAYLYIVNWQAYGNPFGSPIPIDTLPVFSQKQGGTIAVTPMPTQPPQTAPNPPAQESTRRPAGILSKLAYNTPRLLYQALDPGGLPNPLDGYALKVKAQVARAFVQWIGFETIEGPAFTARGHPFDFSKKNINEENQAWYGPLSVLLLFPAILWGAWRGLRAREYLKLGAGLALLTFLPLEIFLRPGWDPYQGRYFAPLVALGAPLLAVWFKKKGSGWRDWLISALAVTIIAVTLLYNPSKPTLGRYADEFHIWTNDRIFLETIQRKNERGMYYMVEKSVPAEATLGYYVPFYMPDYPLFGARISRRLVPIIQPAQVADSQWLHSQGIEYLLLATRNNTPIPPSEYQLIAQLPDWRLYAYAPAP